MSAIDTDTLKSASDLNIIFDTRPEVIALLQIRHDSLLEFGRLIKTTKIVNEDGLNNITYRTKSPSAPLRTVPPNSDETIEEWTSYLEINPNPVTGDGLLEMDLVLLKDARKMLSRPDASA